MWWCPWCFSCWLLGRCRIPAGNQSDIMWKAELHHCMRLFWDLCILCCFSCWTMSACTMLERYLTQTELHLSFSGVLKSVCQRLLMKSDTVSACLFLPMVQVDLRRSCYRLGMVHRECSFLLHVCSVRNLEVSVTSPPSWRNRELCTDDAPAFWFLTHTLQLSVMDVSAQTTMKGAAKCDKHCDLQNSVNQQIPERIYHIQDMPGCVPTSVVHFLIPPRC